jgi:hypothetical protein
VALRSIPSICISLALLGGCAASQVDPASLRPVASSNVLKPEFTTPRPGTAHVTLYRVPENPGKVCDAVVQLSFHDVPGGRIADVAKVWPNDQLDMYLDPGRYRLNVYSAICGTTPTDVDLSLKAGDDLVYRLTTSSFSMWLTPVTH